MGTKKKLLVLICLCALFTAHSVNAIDFMVTGAGTSAVNGTYTPTGSTNFDGNPVWTNGTYYLHADCCMTWVLSTDSDFADDMMAAYRQRDQNPFDAETPPEDGWERRMGDDPVPTVGPAGRSLSYSDDFLLESMDNDGSIPTTFTIEINKFEGEVFTGSNGDNFVEDNKITFSNLPTGITAVAQRENDSTIVVSFSGNADNHANSNDYDTLILAFTDLAFSGDEADSVMNDSLTLTVEFREMISVGSSGADYTTIQGAIDNATNYDILNIAGEVFTESNITVDKILVLSGQGPDSTIVQAHASYDMATERVFYVDYIDRVEFYNMTVRNGKHILGDAYGAGIRSYADYTLVNNCEIAYNISRRQSNYQNQGGGLYMEDGEVINSWIHNNTVTNESQISTNGGGISAKNLILRNTTVSDNISDYYGGGIYVRTSAYITNSTISGNTAANSGGGINFYDNYAPSAIINSTIVNNASGVYGGGFYSYTFDSLIVKNSIIQNNTATTNGANLAIASNNWTKLSVYNSILDSIYNYNQSRVIIGDSINIITDEPMLDTLGNYGGYIPVHALLPGSPAIGAANDNYAPYRDQLGRFRNGTSDIGAVEYDGIVKLSQVVTFDSISIKDVDDEDFSLADISDRGLEINYASSDESVADISGSVVSILSAGEIVITASQPGNDSVEAAVSVQRVLRINNTGVLTTSECNQYDFNGTLLTESDTYYDTLPNSALTDSLITLNLTILESTEGSDTRTECDSYTWIDGVTYTESNNTAQFTIQNNAGCDSVVSLNLTIKESSSSTINVSVNSGETYTAPDDQIYTESGSYTAIIDNAEGCDSTITINLTVPLSVNNMPNQVFKCYPNPMGDALNIEFLNDQHVAIRVFDLIGNILISEEITGTRKTKLATDMLNPGIYLISIEGDVNNEIIRVIKK